jgi:hypothetical protein
MYIIVFQCFNIQIILMFLKFICLFLYRTQVNNKKFAVYDYLIGIIQRKNQGKL